MPLCSCASLRAVMMVRDTVRASMFCRALACIVFCLLITMGQAMALDAQNEGAELIMHFEIPAQGLESALAHYSEVTGLSVLVASRVTAGLRSTAVRGALSPRQALETLLDGTQLRVRYSSPTAFTLVPPVLSRKRSAMPGKPGGGKSVGSGHRYAGAIQKAVTRTLCQRRVEDFGRYRAGLQLWIDAQGRINRVRIVESSGAGERDRALVQHLTDVVIDAPRPDVLSQPVTIRLKPRPDAMADCRAFGVAPR